MYLGFDLEKQNKNFKKLSVPLFFLGHVPLEERGTIVPFSVLISFCNQQK